MVRPFHWIEGKVEIIVAVIGLGSALIGLIAALVSEASRYFLKQNGVLEQHFAFNTEDNAMTVWKVDLCDLSGHFSSFRCYVNAKVYFKFRFSRNS